MLYRVPLIGGDGEGGVKVEKIDCQRTGNFSWMSVDYALSVIVKDVFSF